MNKKMAMRKRRRTRIKKMALKKAKKLEKTLKKNPLNLKRLYFL
jgi:hypothetical protein